MARPSPRFRVEVEPAVRALLEGPAQLLAGPEAEDGGRPGGDLGLVLPGRSAASSAAPPGSQPAVSLASMAWPARSWSRVITVP